jgi:tetratricopeptide (TPR) repeat protein
MSRGLCLVLWPAIAFAQASDPDPIGKLASAYYDAHREGRFEQAAASREQARALLNAVPPASLSYGQWAVTVASLYEQAARGAQARDVLTSTLDRATTAPARFRILAALANSWEQDQNFLKAAGYMEKTIAILESTPPPRDGSSRSFGLLFANGLVAINGRVPDDHSYYERLANLYRTLGRRKDYEALQASLRSISQGDKGRLAAIVERDGDLDSALALLKAQFADALADPKAERWQITQPAQSLASLYERQHRPDDAVTVLQQAISAMNTSGSADAREQSRWLQQSVALVLSNSGRKESADQQFKELIAGAAGQPEQYAALTSYANHLAQTQRAAQAVEVLQNLLSNGGLETHQEIALFHELARVSAMTGDSKSAEEYRLRAKEMMEEQNQREGRQANITDDLSQIQRMARNDPEAAFDLAMRAIDRAWLAPDREQVAAAVPAIASSLPREKSAQLYQKLIATLDAWAVDSPGPLISALRYYSSYDPAASDRYRDAIVAAHGAESGQMKEYLRLKISHLPMGSVERTAAAQDLVAFEETLSGKTSRAYLEALGMLAQDLEASPDRTRVLPIQRQMIEIADLVYTPNDQQRGHVRIQVALAFARQRQFDEADRIAAEAVSLASQWQPPNPTVFDGYLGQIRTMKARQTAR